MTCNFEQREYFFLTWFLSFIHICIYQFLNFKSDFLLEYNILSYNFLFFFNKMSLARSQDAKTTQNILKEKEEQTKQRRRGTKPKSPQRSTNLKQGMPSLF